MSEQEKTPLPWRAEGGVIYDADGVFVLDCWHEDAARIVAAVNGVGRATELQRAVVTLDSAAATKDGHGSIMLDEGFINEVFGWPVQCGPLAAALIALAAAVAEEGR